MGLEVEVLNKIFESSVLTDENKAQIKEAFEAIVNEAKEQARVEVKAELAEQFVTEKEKLIEALDTKLESALRSELEELKESINAFRDLEVEYAEKLVEAKKELADVLKNDMSELVEGLDAFLEFRLREEFNELNESIEEAKKLAFGKKIFESFMNEFKTNFVSEDETTNELVETKKQLEQKNKMFAEVSNELKAFKRTTEMNRVLETLSGKSREVMEAILRTVPTEKLEETYNTYIARVLHESVNTVGEKTEKENDTSSVLAESNTSTKNDLGKAKVLTGDSESLMNENSSIEKGNGLSEDVKRQLRKLAGIEN